MRFSFNSLHFYESEVKMEVDGSPCPCQRHAAHQLHKSTTQPFSSETQRPKSSPGYPSAATDHKPYRRQTTDPVVQELGSKAKSWWPIGTKTTKTPAWTTEPSQPGDGTIVINLVRKMSSSPLPLHEATQMVFQQQMSAKIPSTNRRIHHPASQVKQPKTDSKKLVPVTVDSDSEPEQNPVNVHILQPGTVHPASSAKRILHPSMKQCKHAVTRDLSSLGFLVSSDSDPTSESLPAPSPHAPLISSKRIRHPGSVRKTNMQPSRTAQLPLSSQVYDSDATGKLGSDIQDAQSMIKLTVEKAQSQTKRADNIPFDGPSDNATPGFTIRPRHPASNRSALRAASNQSRALPQTQTPIMHHGQPAVLQSARPLSTACSPTTSSDASRSPSTRLKDTYLIDYMTDSGSVTPGSDVSTGASCDALESCRGKRGVMQKVQPVVAESRNPYTTAGDVRRQLLGSFPVATPGSVAGPGVGGSLMMPRVPLSQDAGRTSTLPSASTSNKARKGNRATTSAAGSLQTSGSAPSAAAESRKALLESLAARRQRAAAAASALAAAGALEHRVASQLGSADGAETPYHSARQTASNGGLPPASSARLGKGTSFLNQETILGEVSSSAGEESEVGVVWYTAGGASETVRGSLSGGALQGQAAMQHNERFQSAGSSSAVREVWYTAGGAASWGGASSGLPDHRESIVSVRGTDFSVGASLPFGSTEGLQHRYQTIGSEDLGSAVLLSESSSLNGAEEWQKSESAWNANTETGRRNYTVGGEAGVQSAFHASGLSKEVVSDKGVHGGSNSATYGGVSAPPGRYIEFSCTDAGASPTQLSEKQEYLDFLAWQRKQQQQQQQYIRLPALNEAAPHLGHHKEQQQQQDKEELRRRSALLDAMLTPRNDVEVSVPLAFMTPVHLPYTTLAGVKQSASAVAATTATATATATEKGTASATTSLDSSTWSATAGMAAAAQASAALSAAAASLTATMPLSQSVDYSNFHLSPRFLPAPPLSVLPAPSPHHSMALAVPAPYHWSSGVQTDPEVREVGSQSHVMADAGCQSLSLADMGTSPFASPFQRSRASSRRVSSQASVQGQLVLERQGRLGARTTSSSVSHSLPVKHDYVDQEDWATQGHPQVKHNYVDQEDWATQVHPKVEKSAGQDSELESACWSDLNHESSNLKIIHTHVFPSTQITLSHLSTAEPNAFQEPEHEDVLQLHESDHTTLHPTHQNSSMQTVTVNPDIVLGSEGDSEFPGEDTAPPADAMLPRLSSQQDVAEIVSSHAASGKVLEESTLPSAIVSSVLHGSIDVANSSNWPCPEVLLPVNAQEQDVDIQALTVAYHAEGQLLQGTVCVESMPYSAACEYIIASLTASAVPDRQPLPRAGSLSQWQAAAGSIVPVPAPLDADFDDPQSGVEHYLESSRSAALNEPGEEDAGLVSKGGVLVGGEGEQKTAWTVLPEDEDEAAEADSVAPDLGEDSMAFALATAESAVSAVRRVVERYGPIEESEIVGTDQTRPVPPSSINSPSLTGGQLVATAQMGHVSQASSPGRRKRVPGLSPRMAAGRMSPRRGISALRKSHDSSPKSTPTRGRLGVRAQASTPARLVAPNSTPLRQRLEVSSSAYRAPPQEHLASPSVIMSPKQALQLHHSELEPLAVMTGFGVAHDASSNHQEADIQMEGLHMVVAKLSMVLEDMKELQAEVEEAELAELRRYKAELDSHSRLQDLEEVRPGLAELQPGADSVSSQPALDQGSSLEDSISIADGLENKHRLQRVALERAVTPPRGVCGAVMRLSSPRQGLGNDAVRTPSATESLSTGSELGVQSSNRQSASHGSVGLAARRIASSSPFKSPGRRLVSIAEVHESEVSGAGSVSCLILTPADQAAIAPRLMSSNKSASVGGSWSRPNEPVLFRGMQTTGGVTVAASAALQGTDVAASESVLSTNSTSGPSPPSLLDASTSMRGGRLGMDQSTSLAGAPFTMDQSSSMGDGLVATPSLLDAATSMGGGRVWLDQSTSLSGASFNVFNDQSSSMGGGPLAPSPLLDAATSMGGGRVCLDQSTSLSGAPFNVFNDQSSSMGGGPLAPSPLLDAATSMGGGRVWLDQSTSLSGAPFNVFNDQSSSMGGGPLAPSPLLDAATSMGGGRVWLDQSTSLSGAPFNVFNDQSSSMGGGPLAPSTALLDTATSMGGGRVWLDQSTSLSGAPLVSQPSPTSDHRPQTLASLSAVTGGHWHQSAHHTYYSPPQPEAYIDSRPMRSTADTITSVDVHTMLQSMIKDYPPRASQLVKETSVSVSGRGAPSALNPVPERIPSTTGRGLRVVEEQLVVHDWGWQQGGSTPAAGGRPEVVHASDSGWRQALYATPPRYAVLEDTQGLTLQSRSNKQLPSQPSIGGSSRSSDIWMSAGGSSYAGTASEGGGGGNNTRDLAVAVQPYGSRVSSTAGVGDVALDLEAAVQLSGSRVSSAAGKGPRRVLSSFDTAALGPTRTVFPTFHTPTVSSGGISLASLPSLPPSSHRDRSSAAGSSYQGWLLHGTSVGRRDTRASTFSAASVPLSDLRGMSRGGYGYGELQEGDRRITAVSTGSHGTSREDTALTGLAEGDLVSEASLMSRYGPEPLLGQPESSRRMTSTSGLTATSVPSAAAELVAEYHRIERLLQRGLGDEGEEAEDDLSRRATQDSGITTASIPLESIDPLVASEYDPETLMGGDGRISRRTTGGSGITQVPAPRGTADSIAEADYGDYDQIDADHEVDFLEQPELAGEEDALSQGLEGEGIAVETENNSMHGGEVSSAVDISQHVTEELPVGRQTDGSAVTFCREQRRTVSSVYEPLGSMGGVSSAIYDGAGLEEGELQNTGGWQNIIGAPSRRDTLASGITMASAPRSRTLATGASSAVYGDEEVYTGRPEQQYTGETPESRTSRAASSVGYIHSSSVGGHGTSMTSQHALQSQGGTSGARTSMTSQHALRSQGGTSGARTSMATSFQSQADAALEYEELDRLGRLRRTTLASTATDSAHGALHVEETPMRTRDGLLGEQEGLLQMRKPVISLMPKASTWGGAVLITSNTASSRDISNENHVILAMSSGLNPVDSGAASTLNPDETAAAAPILSRVNAEELQATALTARLMDGSGSQMRTTDSSTTQSLITGVPSTAAASSTTQSLITGVPSTAAASSTSQSLITGVPSTAAASSTSQSLITGVPSTAAASSTTQSLITGVPSTAAASSTSQSLITGVPSTAAASSTTQSLITGALIAADMGFQANMAPAASNMAHTAASKVSSGFISPGSSLGGYILDPATSRLRRSPVQTQASVQQQGYPSGHGHPVPRSLLESLRESDEWQQQPGSALLVRMSAGLTAKEIMSPLASRNVSPSHYSTQTPMYAKAVLEYPADEQPASAPLMVDNEGGSPGQALEKKELYQAEAASEQQELVASVGYEEMMEEMSLFEPTMMNAEEAVDAAVAAVAAAVAALTPIRVSAAVGGDDEGEDRWAVEMRDAYTSTRMQRDASSSMSGVPPDNGETRSASTSTAGSNNQAVNQRCIMRPPSTSGSEARLLTGTELPTLSEVPRAATTGGASMSDERVTQKPLIKFRSAAGSYDPHHPLKAPGVAFSAAMFSPVPVLVAPGLPGNPVPGVDAANEQGGLRQVTEEEIQFGNMTPGSGMSATLADLERLKEDILDGLRQALLEVLPGVMQQAPLVALASSSRAGAGAAASGVLRGPEFSPGGGVRLSRADLEAFLFDKEVLSRDSSADLMAHRLRDLYVRASRGGGTQAAGSDEESSYDWRSVQSATLNTPAGSITSSPRALQTEGQLPTASFSPGGGMPPLAPKPATAVQATSSQSFPLHPRSLPVSPARRSLFRDSGSRDIVSEGGDPVRLSTLRKSFDGAAIRYVMQKTLEGLQRSPAVAQKTNLSSTASGTHGDMSLGNSIGLMGSHSSFSHNDASHNPESLSSSSNAQGAVFIIQNSRLSEKAPPEVSIEEFRPLETGKAWESPQGFRLQPQNVADTADLHQSSLDEWGSVPRSNLTLPSSLPDEILEPTGLRREATFGPQDSDAEVTSPLPTRASSLPFPLAMMEVCDDDAETNEVAASDSAAEHEEVPVDEVDARGPAAEKLLSEEHLNIVPVCASEALSTGVPMALEGVGMPSASEAPTGVPMALGGVGMPSASEAPPTGVPMALGGVGMPSASEAPPTGVPMALGGVGMEDLFMSFTSPLVNIAELLVMTTSQLQFIAPDHQGEEGVRRRTSTASVMITEVEDGPNEYGSDEEPSLYYTPGMRPDTSLTSRAASLGAEQKALGHEVPKTYVQRSVLTTNNTQYEHSPLAAQPVTPAHQAGGVSKFITPTLKGSQKSTAAVTASHDGSRRSYSPSSLQHSPAPAATSITQLESVISELRQLHEERLSPMSTTSNADSPLATLNSMLDQTAVRSNTSESSPVRTGAHAGAVTSSLDILLQQVSSIKVMFQDAPEPSATYNSSAAAGSVSLDSPILASGFGSKGNANPEATDQLEDLMEQLNQLNVLFGANVAAAPGAPDLREGNNPQSAVQEGPRAAWSPPSFDMPKMRGGPEASQDPVTPSMNVAKDVGRTDAQQDEEAWQEFQALLTQAQDLAQLLLEERTRSASASPDLSPAVTQFPQYSGHDASTWSPEPGFSLSRTAVSSLSSGSVEEEQVISTPGRPDEISDHCADLLAQASDANLDRRVFSCDLTTPNSAQFDEPYNPDTYSEEFEEDASQPNVFTAERAFLVSTNPLFDNSRSLERESVSAMSPTANNVPIKRQPEVSSSSVSQSSMNAIMTSTPVPPLKEENAIRSPVSSDMDTGLSTQAGAVAVVGVLNEDDVQGMSGHAARQRSSSGSGLKQSIWDVVDEGVQHPAKSSTHSQEGQQVVLGPKQRRSSWTWEKNNKDSVWSSPQIVSTSDPHVAKQENAPSIGKEAEVSELEPRSEAGMVKDSIWGERSGDKKLQPETLRSTAQSSSIWIDSPEAREAVDTSHESSAVVARRAASSRLSGLEVLQQESLLLLSELLAGEELSDSDEVDEEHGADQRPGPEQSIVSSAAGASYDQKVEAGVGRSMQSCPIAKDSTTDSPEEHDEGEALNTASGQLQPEASLVTPRVRSRDPSGSELAIRMSRGGSTSDYMLASASAAKPGFSRHSAAMEDLEPPFPAAALAARSDSVDIQSLVPVSADSDTENLLSDCLASFSAFEAPPEPSLAFAASGIAMRPEQSGSGAASAEAPGESGRKSVQSDRTADHRPPLSNTSLPAMPYQEEDRSDETEEDELEVLDAPEEDQKGHFSQFLALQAQELRPDPPGLIGTGSDNHGMAAGQADSSFHSELPLRPSEEGDGEAVDHEVDSPEEVHDHEVDSPEEAHPPLISELMLRLPEQVIQQKVADSGPASAVPDDLYIPDTQEMPVGSPVSPRHHPEHPLGDSGPPSRRSTTSGAGNYLTAASGEEEATLVDASAAIAAAASGRLKRTSWSGALKSTPEEELTVSQDLEDLTGPSNSIPLKASETLASIAGITTEHNYSAPSAASHNKPRLPTSVVSGRTGMTTAGPSKLPTATATAASPPRSSVNASISGQSMLPAAAASSPPRGSVAAMAARFEQHLPSAQGKHTAVPTKAPALKAGSKVFAVQQKQQSGVYSPGKAAAAMIRDAGKPSAKPVNLVSGGAPSARIPAASMKPATKLPSTPSISTTPSIPSPAAQQLKSPASTFRASNIPSSPRQ
ncbi:hypothetical protein CEUSTIGMA_g3953.t1 [Chlamydomonas eustigma]|uniref:Uncharacterized protein n=1 Tax=Chlamydomonas eustigma TaxID=1157962 RepID=A0A250X0B3_9CHLO|nr:hypothetical protein CEUSTIGMA_g3953.t1 [Chlamydomonas eustigma]|eukprot:GAX76508.1 hypothetical protein CEUSTIGMA_g3953.t1 [Chlamydomonas eustigma]